MRAHSNGELQAWLDGTLYPALFRNLPSAFPEFGWRRFSRGWQATRWPATFPEAVDHPNPERLQVYSDGPAYIKIHGRGAIRFLHLASGDPAPRGERFVEAIRELAGRAGVDASFLERELTPEEQAQAHTRELRRAALSVVIEACQDRLHSEAGQAARDYLASRGLSEEDMMHFRLGLYDLAGLREVLARGRFAPGAVGAVLRDNFNGYIVFPWGDAFGYPLTLYGRWPGEPPEGRPKTMALPGEGTKGAPFCLDRALRAGHRELVAVEGIMDAVLLQARGETRAVAYVAAQFSTTQVETLARHRIERVVLCGDPDGGGDKGTLHNVEHLEAAGLPTLVMERLPDGLDPDELLLRDGIEAWRDRVLGATPGRVWQAQQVLGDVSASSPDGVRRKALEQLKFRAEQSVRQLALEKEIDAAREEQERKRREKDRRDAEELAHKDPPGVRIDRALIQLQMIAGGKTVKMEAQVVGGVEHPSRLLAERNDEEHRKALTAALGLARKLENTLDRLRRSPLPPPKLADRDAQLEAFLGYTPEQIAQLDPRQGLPRQIRERRQALGLDEETGDRLVEAA